MMLPLSYIPGPGWTDCWGLGSGLGTGLVICPRLQFSGTSSNLLHTERWQSEGRQKSRCEKMTQAQRNDVIKKKKKTMTR